jgi:hypothetical protein
LSRSSYLHHYGYVLCQFAPEKGVIPEVLTEDELTAKAWSWNEETRTGIKIFALNKLGLKGHEQSSECSVPLTDFYLKAWTPRHGFEQYNFLRSKLAEEKKEQQRKARIIPYIDALLQHREQGGSFTASQEEFLTRHAAAAAERGSFAIEKRIDTLVEMQEEGIPLQPKQKEYLQKHHSLQVKIRQKRKKRSQAPAIEEIPIPLPRFRGSGQLLKKVHDIAEKGRRDIEKRYRSQQAPY